MIEQWGAMANNKNNIKNLVPFPKGHSGNPHGRPKGRKSLASIIRELEDEQFNWKQLPIKDRKKMEELVSDFGPIGSPFRVVVYKALMDSIFGKGIEKVAARDFLRRSGYGDKLDIDVHERKIERPAIITEIKKRTVAPPPETEEELTP